MPSESPLSPQGRRRRMVSSQSTEWKRSLPSGSRFNALFNNRSRPRTFKGSELAGVRGAKHCRSPTAAATRTKKMEIVPSFCLLIFIVHGFAIFCDLIQKAKVNKSSDTSSQSNGEANICLIWTWKKFSVKYWLQFLSFSSLLVLPIFFFFLFFFVF